MLEFHQAPLHMRETTEENRWGIVGTPCKLSVSKKKTPNQNPHPQTTLSNRRFFVTLGTYTTEQNLKLPQTRTTKCCPYSLNEDTSKKRTLEQAETWQVRLLLLPSRISGNWIFQFRSTIVAPPTFLGMPGYKTLDSPCGVYTNQMWAYIDCKFQEVLNVNDFKI